MKLTFVFIFILLFLTVDGVAQKPYAVRQYMRQIKLHKVPQQGMDIVKNKIFVLHDGGTCHVYDFKTKKVISSFDLASKRKGNHCNTGNFGIEKVKGASFPVMYISLGKPGDVDEFVCLVESFTECKGKYTSEIVQRIKMDQSQFEAKGLKPIWGCPNWVVDKERKHLWAFSAIKRTIRSVTGPFESNKYIAVKYRLPKLSEGKEIVLTANDVLDEAVMEFDAYATQGGTMKDGKIYYAFGFGKKHPESPSQLRVYDTDKQCIVQRYDITDDVPEEPEDVAVYKGKIYLNTNSDKIYVITSER